MKRKIILSLFVIICMVLIVGLFYITKLETLNRQLNNNKIEAPEK